MRWITKTGLLMLHEQSLFEHGGSSGIRDEGLLDSALARPQNIHFYRPEGTLAELAAAYCFGVAKNHAFVDGNKRAAFAATGARGAATSFTELPEDGAMDGLADRVAVRVSRLMLLEGPHECEYPNCPHRKL